MDYFLTLKSHECQNSKFKKNSKFNFIKNEKQMVPCKGTAKEVSFKWSHHRILLSDSKVELHYMSPLLTLGVKRLKAFLKAQNLWKQKAHRFFF